MVTLPSDTVPSASAPLNIGSNNEDPFLLHHNQGMQTMAPRSSFEYSESNQRNTIHDLMHRIWEECSFRS